MPIYTCDKCNKEFANKTMLTRHQAKKIPCDKCRDLTCPICDVEFAKLFNVEKHMLDKHPEHPRSKTLSALASQNASSTSTQKTIQVAETINNITNNNVSVHITFQLPNNISSPNIEFLTKLSPAELKKKIDLMPEVATLARLFKEIHLSEVKQNHNVLLEESSDVGYFFQNKWRKEAKECLLDRCASLSASELTDIDYIFSEGLSKRIAEELSTICSAVESEQLDTVRSEDLKSSIKEALTTFTSRHPDLLSYAKDAATSKKIIHDKAKAFEEWKAGGVRYEAFLEAYRG